jgi:hypothetical protein
MRSSLIEVDDIGLEEALELLLMQDEEVGTAIHGSG